MHENFVYSIGPWEPLVSYTHSLVIIIVIHAYAFCNSSMQYFLTRRDCSFRSFFPAKKATLCKDVHFGPTDLGRAHMSWCHDIPMQLKYIWSTLPNGRALHCITPNGSSRTESRSNILFPCENSRSSGRWFRFWRVNCSFRLLYKQTGFLRGNNGTMWYKQLS